MQALRAAAVTALSMLAAALAATAVFGAADGSWPPVLFYGSGAVGTAGLAARAFRAWLKHSPRHKGRH